VVGVQLLGEASPSRDDCVGQRDRLIMVPAGALGTSGCAR
jgi:hypothetical protein